MAVLPQMAVMPQGAAMPIWAVMPQWLSYLQKARMLKVYNPNNRSYIQYDYPFGVYYGLCIYIECSKNSTNTCFPNSLSHPNPLPCHWALLAAVCGLSNRAPDVHFHLQNSFVHVESWWDVSAACQSQACKDGHGN